MIEKAWAKMHGSYERIEGGDTQTTVRDLTGAPGETLDLKEKDANPEEIYQHLKQADELNYIICCSVDAQDADE